MHTLLRKENKALEEIKAYKHPRLSIGKEWCIIFYAYDPAQQKMRRKRIKLNHIEGVTARRKYANGLLQRITAKLEKGWNPWIEAENERAYHLFSDVCSHYKRYIDKMYSDNLYREDTYVSYLSFIRNVERWNEKQKNPITYVYQFNEDFIRDFMDHIYLERKNSAQTRNNYVGFLKTFSTFLLQNHYIKVKPTEGLAKISRRMIKKERTIISEKDMKRLSEYLYQKNKHYLLAAYILHYCFIRPKEMSMIKLNHISIKHQTIIIPEDISKNRKTSTVTLPVKVIHLMLELDVFSHPSDHYLFSDKFMPGEDYRNEKQFRDFWITRVRKELKFPGNYKFYSLKDTGITSMLRQYDTITVRDQARHADILMTDKYTPHDIQEANELIKNHEGVF